MKKALMIMAAASFVMAAGTSVAVAGAESKCKACHTFDQGGKNKTGPNLFGIVGKKAGSTEGFKYGSYLKGSDFTWDETRLRAWILSSKKVAKAAHAKTKMPAQKVKGKKADAVIAFLKGLK
ncbi:MAG: c-type cytochrome [Mariprofundaceae bacterium]|nr:c-type cytochrome [Mariprofundaceae bacterium]